MNWLYFTPLVFLLIAFVFSMLGMGGSQIYIPILFWFGLDFKSEAIPLGMLLNLVNSTSAAVTYARKKMIDWKVALPFGVMMVIFAPIGALLNVKLPEKLLILLFAIFTIIAAILMLSGWKPKSGDYNTKQKILLGIVGGFFLGLFAGLLGRGGGSFVVPLLYMAGLAPKIAAATSAFVVSCSGLSSFISHVFIAAKPDWLLWILCSLGVLIGSQLGSRVMAVKLNSRKIKPVFGGVLLLVSAILIFQTFI
ncbi:MAG: sulfite exporter TauE/SafE family protein [Candidatus Lokiarchaeota archaeon]|nr:sulfite exporter TauE/SafE family protein [Candidatus Harpocratesius repetitus]